MFTTIGVGIGTIFKSVKGDSGGGPFEYTAIDNSFSMKFDGSASYYEIGTDSSLDIFGSDFSASLWFNTSDTATASGLIQIGSFTNRVFAITKGNAADKIGFVYGINSWYYNIGSGLNDGNWHHVVLVRNTGTYTVYIDKVPYTSFTGPGTYNTGGYNSIGKGLTSPKYFNGNLDEIALFNHAISENIVNSIYDTTANNPGKVADLSETPGGAPVAWYRMGD